MQEIAISKFKATWREPSRAPTFCSGNSKRKAIDRAIGNAIIFPRRKGSMKTGASYTIDPEVVEYIADTKGSHSASYRANELLKRAIIEERYRMLEAEAEAFFANASNTGRTGTLAFQKAALRTFEKD
jgi:hypothetical protein